MPRILAKHDVDERIIVGILDDSQDAAIFRPSGPAVHIDDPTTDRDKLK